MAEYVVAQLLGTWGTGCRLQTHARWVEARLVKGSRRTGAERQRGRLQFGRDRFACVICEAVGQVAV